MRITNTPPKLRSIANKSNHIDTVAAHSGGFAGCSAGPDGSKGRVEAKLEIVDVDALPRRRHPRRLVGIAAIEAL